MNQSENELAMEMSKVDNRSLSDFEMFHEKLETLLHPKHYLMIMLKRHLVHLYSSVLAQLDDEDLERVAGFLYHLQLICSDVTNDFANFSRRNKLQ